MILLPADTVENIWGGMLFQIEERPDGALHLHYELTPEEYENGFTLSTRENLE